MRALPSGNEWLLALALLAACSSPGPASPGTMSVPDGWTWVELGSQAGIAVPPDAELAPGTPVDSLAGVYEGDGYRITYDLGRFPEDVEAVADVAGVAVGSRDVAGSTAVEIAFVPDDEPFAHARILQVAADEGRTLTIRVSCDSVDRCGIADGVFDSVQLD